MKKLITILLLFFTNWFCNAQNWQTIVSGKEYYFMDNIGQDYHNLYCFQADSIISNVLGDTTYFNYEQVRNEIYSGGFISDTTWMGVKVMCKQGGTNYFFNKNGDTLSIHTLAKQDSSWIFFKDTSGYYFEAKVSSIHIDSSGLTDSLKTIFITCKDSLGNLYDHEQDSIEIEISKNNGFIRLHTFLYFPNYYDPFNGFISSIPIIRDTTGITNFGVKEIFDFDIGDEFHYYAYEDPGNGWGGSLTIKETYDYYKVIDKRISINQDTIIYKKIKKSSTKTEYWSSGFDTTFFTILNDTIESKIISSELRYLNTRHMEPVFYDNYNLDISAITGKNSKKYLYPSFYYENNTKYIPAGIDCAGGYSPIYYEKGIGEFSKDYCCMTMSCYNYNYLKYYKKTNGEEWGTPIPDWRFTGVEEKDPETLDGSDIKVYPNPVNSVLFIEGENLDNICLYNQLGQTIKLPILFQSENKISYSTTILVSGIYLVSINNKCYKLVK